MFFWSFRALAFVLLVILSLPLGALLLGSSADALMAAMQDSEVWHALGVSLACATAATILALLLGVPAGYILSQPQLRGRRLLGALIDLPLVVPHPVIGLGLLAVFAQRRLVGAALRDGFGIEVASATPGIVIAMLVVSAPFVVKAARDAFLRLPPDYARTARSLGASETRVFLQVLLPCVRQPVATGTLMAWARALSEFGSVMVLAYYPRTMPVLIWDRFTTRGLQEATAPALVLCAVCIAFFFVAQPVTGQPDNGVEP